MGECKWGNTSQNRDFYRLFPSLHFLLQFSKHMADLKSTNIICDLILSFKVNRSESTGIAYKI